VLQPPLGGGLSTCCRLLEDAPSVRQDAACCMLQGAADGDRRDSAAGVAREWTMEIETRSFQMQNKSFVLLQCYAVTAVSLLVIKL
jgi:hypothetical protein